jgi:hypothetical protein
MTPTRIQTGTEGKPAMNTEPANLAPPEGLRRRLAEHRTAGRIADILTSGTADLPGHRQESLIRPAEASAALWTPVHTRNGRDAS